MTYFFLLSFLNTNYGRLNSVPLRAFLEPKNVIVRVNFMHRLNCALGNQIDICSNVSLGVTLKVFLDEFNI